MFEKETNKRVSIKLDKKGQEEIIKSTTGSVVRASLASILEVGGREPSILGGDRGGRRGSWGRVVDGSWSIITGYFVQEVCLKVVIFQEKF